jgi:hypothetical protein
MRSTYKKLIPIFFATLLVGCGGGGDSTKFGLNGTTPTGTSGTSASTLALGSGVAGGFTTGSMTLGLSTGASLPYGGTTTVSVNIVDTTNNNALSTSSNTVTFTSNCSASGKATITSSVTTSTGIATATYNASTCDTSDTVTATLSGTAVTATTTITIAAPTTSTTSTSLSLGTGSGTSFSSGAMTTSLGSGSLSFGGTATVSVNLVDATTKALSTSTNTVKFSSDCAARGDATIDSSVVTNSGTATATYKAINCQSADTITATLPNGTTATTTIKIALQQAGSLAFSPPTPSTIAIKGSSTSAFPEVSTIKTTFLDNQNNPIKGATVNYSLSSTDGGISLSNASAITAADGTSSIQLNAGSADASITVNASVTYNGKTITNTSSAIAIVGSLPDQDSFTIAAKTFNPLGYNVAGTTVTITVIANDLNNHPASNGTQVVFRTDYGGIVGTCALSGGTCSVDWKSSNPLPANGIVHVLAFTTGEESFKDLNNNGLFDVGDTVTTNLSEAFIDPNRTTGGNPPASAYTLGDIFVDYNNDGSFTKKTNTLFQGIHCSAAAKQAGNCQNLVDVRQSLVLCMSTIATNVTSSQTSLSVTAGTKNTTNTTLTFKDANGNMPANGTTIAVSTDNGTIVSGGTINVPNLCTNTGFSTTVTLAGDGTSSNGNLKVVVTQPNGVIKTLLIPFTD